MSHLDQALIDVFDPTGDSVDRIACFHDVRQRFLGRLPAHCRGGTDDDVIWRLFQLRKSGKLRKRSAIRTTLSAKSTALIHASEVN